MTNIFNWDPNTAANNDDADSPTVNWIEGQLASTVNNSARGMMLRVAQLIYDNSGKITSTGGTNTYLVSTKSGFASYAEPMMGAFTAHAGNTGSVTLSVDGVGAKPLYNTHGFPLVSGEIRTGGVYEWVYDSTYDAFLTTNLPGSARGWRFWSPTKSLVSGTNVTITNFGGSISNLGLASTVSPSAGSITIGEGDEGFYVLTASYSTVGSTFLELIQILVNGSKVVADAVTVASDTAELGRSTSTLVYLAVGDVVTSTYNQSNSGSSTFSVLADASSQFSGARIGY